MGSKTGARKQSKAMKIVLAAIRTFSKAKNFYMVSMEKFGNGVAGNPNPQASTLARSYSVSSAKKVDDQAGLPRSMSKSRTKPNYIYGVGRYNNNNKGFNEEMKRSCSVVEKKKKKMMMMMMRRIDEDESCSFKEDDDDDFTAHHNLLYPRSKSHSVKKNTSYMRLL